MSILSGMVDRHHETELNPSTQLVTGNWLVRHLWTVLLLVVAAVLYIVL